MTTALEGNKGSASRPGRSLPTRKTRYPLYRRLGGPQGRSGQVRKLSPPTGIRSPDRPASNQSLYRLRYPAHDVNMCRSHKKIIRFSSINFLRRIGPNRRCRSFCRAWLWPLQRELWPTPNLRMCLLLHAVVSKTAVRSVSPKSREGCKGHRYAINTACLSVAIILFSVTEVTYTTVALTAITCHKIRILDRKACSMEENNGVEASGRSHGRWK